MAVGQPSGAENFQVEVVALGQPSGTAQGSACRARRARTVLLLLLLHHRLARSFCCGLEAEMERGGRSSLLHVARRVCTSVPNDVSPAQSKEVLERRFFLRVPRSVSGQRSIHVLERRFLLRVSRSAPGHRSWLGWMTWQRVMFATSAAEHVLTPRKNEACTKWVEPKWLRMMMGTRTRRRTRRMKMRIDDDGLMVGDH